MQLLQRLFGNSAIAMAEKIQDAEQRLEALEDVYIAALQLKERKVLRQSEMWALDTTQPDLEAEYKKVAGEVATLARELLALDTMREQLRLEKFHCSQQGACQRLTELLLLPLLDSKNYPAISELSSLPRHV